MNSTKKDSASAMPPLKEEHFFHHSSQTNVYGTTTVCLPNLNKLLIATSAGIHSLEYQKTEENGLKPVSKRIQFTYIPGMLTLQFASFELERKESSTEKKNNLLGP